MNRRVRGRRTKDGHIVVTNRDLDVLALVAIDRYLSTEQDSISKRATESLMLRNEELKKRIVNIHDMSRMGLNSSKKLLTLSSLKTARCASLTSAWPMYAKRALVM